MTNRAQVSIAQQSEEDLEQQASVGPRDLMEIAESLGYGCTLVSEQDSSKSMEHTQKEEMRVWWRLLVLALAFGLPIMAMHIGGPACDALLRRLVSPRAPVSHFRWFYFMSVCSALPRVVLFFLVPTCLTFGVLFVSGVQCLASCRLV